MFGVGQVGVKLGVGLRPRHDYTAPSNVDGNAIASTFSAEFINKADTGGLEAGAALVVIAANMSSPARIGFFIVA